MLTILLVKLFGSYRWKNIQLYISFSCLISCIKLKQNLIIKQKMDKTRNKTYKQKLLNLKARGPQTGMIRIKWVNCRVRVTISTSYSGLVHNLLLLFSSFGSNPKISLWYTCGESNTWCMLVLILSHVNKTYSWTQPQNG